MSHIIAEMLAVLSYISLLWYLGRRKLGNLPPGPAPLPILGNLLNVSSGSLWKIHRQWKSLYGPLMHVRTFGQSTIILTELDDAIALLEKRSMNYSDRVVTPMMHMSGWEVNFAVLPYGDQWKLQRKLFHQCFTLGATQAYAPVQEKWAGRFIKWLRDAPDRYDAHFTRFVASIVVEITYGHEASGENDHLLESIKTNLEDAMETLHFGKFLVDVVPILQKLPTWFPGTSHFRSAAANTREALRQFVNIPFHDALARMTQSNEANCNVAKLYTQLDQQDPHFEQRLAALRDSMGMAYFGASETTSIALKNLVLLLVAYPEAQTRAREEIQRVIGKERLPVLADRPSLPYVDAVVKESLRILTVAPEGVPHATVNADKYKGFDIPAKTVIMADSWMMLHDARYYEDPFVFRPERYLGPHPDRDPELSGVFGFGRRICPGRFLAVSNIFLIAACMLSQFEIRNAIDKNGKPIPVEIDQQPGLTSQPVPFRCTVQSIAL